MQISIELHARIYYTVQNVIMSGMLEVKPYLREPITG